VFFGKMFYQCFTSTGNGKTKGKTFVEKGTNLTIKRTKRRNYE
jgi:hypothetical protein